LVIFPDQDNSKLRVDCLGLPLLHLLVGLLLGRERDADNLVLMESARDADTLVAQVVENV
jgi:hypothetical protein